MRIAEQPDVRVLAAASAANYTPHSARRGLVERVGDPSHSVKRAALLRWQSLQGSFSTSGVEPVASSSGCVDTGWSGPMRGVEPAADAAAETERRLGVPVKVGLIDDIDIDEGSIGTVVLRHVIEHVRDPPTALARVRSLLEPGGLAYVATPDARAISAKVFGRYWGGYDPPRHLFAFTREGVRMLLAAQGFELVEERWDFAPQFWTGSLRRALGRRRRPAWVTIAGSEFNPIAAGPAVLGAALEAVLHCSAMYAATTRRPA